MFCCTLLYVHSSIAIILMGKRGLIALLNLSSWCLVMVERLFLAVPRGCLQFVIVVFPDHTHLLFFFTLLHHLTNSGSHRFGSLVEHNRMSKVGEGVVDRTKSKPQSIFAALVKTDETTCYVQEPNFLLVYFSKFSPWNISK